MFFYFFYSFAILGFIPFIAVASKMKKAVEREKRKKTEIKEDLPSDKSTPPFLPVIRPTEEIYGKNSSADFNKNLIDKIDTVFDFYAKNRRKSNVKSAKVSTAEFVRKCLYLADKND